MTDIKTLDYSGLKDYEDCPQRFLWSRIEKRKPKIPENAYYWICGTVKQKMFELFVNERWYLKGKDCIPFMESMAPKIFEDTLKWAKVDWSASYAKLTKDDMIQEIKKGVKDGIKIIKDHRLISSSSKSEIKLTANINNWFSLVGKVDFIIKHNDTNESIIVDGKDTVDSLKMPSVDPRQLWIYSLLHQRNYGNYPNKLGFLFWRHDTVLYYDAKEGIEAVTEWAKKSFWDIKKDKFDPKPSQSSCFFCKYKNECDAYKSESELLNIPEGDEITF